MVELITKREDGIIVFSIKNNEMEVWVTNYGCTILKILVKDQNGKVQDCVLGFPTIEDYMKKDGTYLGSLVGRVANRIANGTFSLNHQIYHLPINNGPNSLHGGINGFSYQIFDYTIGNDSIQFHYQSIDGEENYPGTLDLYATYELENKSLRINYQAFSDQDTIINITNHSYFNLNGKPSNIGDHELTIYADSMGCVDQNGLFNGEIREVFNTPFDFNQAKLIKDNIHADNDQLIIAKGYDHPFLFSRNRNQVILYSKETGIELTVSTTLPIAQIYTANYLNGQLDQYGNRMHKQDAICIETQYMPDSINQEKNSKTILRKGNMYEETTSYTFKVRV